MAIQSPFFGKRDVEPTGLRQAVPNTPGTLRTPGTQSSSAYSAANTGTPTHNDTTGSTAAPASTNGATQASAPSAPADPTAGSNSRSEGGSKLTVGPNIKLKGVEITDCDTLFVEGTVEATMDSRLMQIAECGAFKGSAEIDIAEIHGSFDGNLTVREKLVIHATGRVTGTVRYGKLVVEEGGQLSGDILVGTAKAASPARPSSASKAELQAA